MNAEESLQTLGQYVYEITYERVSPPILETL